MHRSNSGRAELAASNRAKPPIAPASNISLTQNFCGCRLHKALDGLAHEGRPSRRDDWNPEKSSNPGPTSNLMRPDIKLGGAVLNIIQISSNISSNFSKTWNTLHSGCIVAVLVKNSLGTNHLSAAVTNTDAKQYTIPLPTPSCNQTFRKQTTPLENFSSGVE